MPTIQLRTEIPGPRSRALMARREAAVPRGPYNSAPIFMASAEGATLEDVDDIAISTSPEGSAVSTSATARRAVVSALREQLEKHLHLCFAVHSVRKLHRARGKLNALTPGKGPKKTIIVNTGAEAVENAIKIARAYTKRPAVICLKMPFMAAPC